MTYELSEAELDAIRANLDLNETGEAIPYSGRGMGDRQCLGIVTDNEARCFMLLGSGLYRSNYDLITELTEVDILRDSMGRSTVVYFPSVVISGGEDE
jgi:hypothetical protein